MTSRLARAFVKSFAALAVGCTGQSPEPSVPALASVMACQPTIVRMVPPDFVVAHVLGGVRPAGDRPSPMASVSPQLFASDKNYLGNDVLWLALPADGKVHGSSVSITAYQTVPGRITVFGRRLDCSGAEAVSTDRDENPGGGPRDRAVTIQFPTQGCWEITYGLAGSELRFVLEVEGP